jgi:hypothetical protein
VICSRWPTACDKPSGRANSLIALRRDLSAERAIRRFVLMPEARSVYREFEDSDGTRWRVWEVVPPANTDEVLSRLPTSVPENASAAIVERRNVQNERRALWTKGWLLFESVSQRKRLIPIPSNWNLATEAELDVMCGSARDVAGEAGSQDPKGGR